MMMFYAEQPVDWLMTSFRLSMGQRQTLLKKPTLFQHFGVKSSFDTSHENNLKDRFDISFDTSRDNKLKDRFVMVFTCHPV